MPCGYHLTFRSQEVVIVILGLQIRKPKHRGKLAPGPKMVREGFEPGHYSSRAQHHPGLALAVCPKPHYIGAKPDVVLIWHRHSGVWKEARVKGSLAES